MTENDLTAVEPIFCTVFDKNYLFQGLTLYRSLEKVLPRFKLYCLALDEVSVTTIQKLNLKNLLILELSDLNQNHVNEIRALTSYGQFCWSMQPLTCLAVLNLEESHVTYIEADAYFFSSPIPLLQEMEGKAASVAPHWYSSRYLKYEAISGLYCTHFNFFRNTPEGRECLEYWRELNFRYRKEKPLSYPGQLGLNDWTTRFKQVGELKNRGAGVAPWNIQNYRISIDFTGKPMVDGKEVIFYHFHQFSKCSDGTFECGHYPLSDSAMNAFYKPYVIELLESMEQVHRVDPDFHNIRVVSQPPSVMEAILSGSLEKLKKATQKFRRILKGTYNVHPEEFFKS